MFDISLILHVYGHQNITNDLCYKLLYSGLEKKLEEQNCFIWIKVEIFTFSNFASKLIPIDHCAYQPVGLVLQLLSISACFLTLCWWRLQLLMITLQTVILNFCSHVVDFLLHYYRTKDNRKFLSDAITLFLHYSLFRKWNLQSHLILYEM